MAAQLQQDIDLEAQISRHVASTSVISPGVASNITDPVDHVSHGSPYTTSDALSGRQQPSGALVEATFTRQQDELPVLHNIMVDARETDGTGSTPERGAEVLANVATTQGQTTTEWNGSLRDWTSWPNGRPGPFISEDALKRYGSKIGDVTTEAERRMRTDELVCHMAEFTESGKGEKLVLGGFQNSHLEFRDFSRSCN